MFAPSSGRVRDTVSLGALPGLRPKYASTDVRCTGRLRHGRSIGVRRVICTRVKRQYVRSYGRFTPGVVPSEVRLVIRPLCVFRRVNHPVLFRH